MFDAQPLSPPWIQCWIWSEESSVLTNYGTNSVTWIKVFKMKGIVSLCLNLLLPRFPLYPEESRTDGLNIVSLYFLSILHSASLKNLISWRSIFSFGYFLLERRQVVHVVRGLLYCLWGGWWSGSVAPRAPPPPPSCSDIIPPVSLPCRLGSGDKCELISMEA